MTAQGQDASARTSHVAEQELKDRGGSNDLRSLGLLGPAQRVADRASLFRARGGAKRVRNFQEPLLGNSAKALNQLRRVPREMPLQHLVHASWMVKRQVAFAIDEICCGSSTIFAVAGVRCVVPGYRFAALSTAFVEPATRVVLLVFRVPARKHAPQILGVLEIFRKNERSVGVMDHVLAKVFPVFENVMNEPSVKQDVCTGAQRRPDICHR